MSYKASQRLVNAFDLNSAARAFRMSTCCMAEDVWHRYVIEQVCLTSNLAQNLQGPKITNDQILLHNRSSMVEDGVGSVLCVL